MSEGYALRQLGDLCDVLDSKRKPITKSDRIPGPFPYYGATGVLDHVADYIFDERLVLVGEDGAKWGSGERTAFPLEGKVWVNNHAHVLRPKRTHLVDGWLIHYLNFADLNEFVSGLTVPKLNQGNLRQIPIPTPAIREQHRIVAILDEAFAGIATAKANAERNLQNARHVFESHLRTTFSENFKGWISKPLSEVCAFSSGGTPAKDIKKYWDGRIPWISGRDMKSTRLDDSFLHISQSAVDETSARVAPPGSLLVLVRGMGLAHGAQIGELTAPCAFNQDIKAIHPKPGLVSRYLLFALRDRINTSKDVLSNAAHGTLKIDSEGLRNLMIPVPSYEHQNEIVEKIDSLSEETKNLESLYSRKLTALTELKQSLLHQAFSGEL